MLAQTQLLTVGEVALRLRQSPRSVRDKIAAGTIPAVKIGSGPRAPIRVDAGELEAWLFSAGTPPPADPGEHIPDGKACVALETFTAGGRSFNAGFRYRRDDPVVRANPELFGTVSVRLSELGGY